MPQIQVPVNSSGELEIPGKISIIILLSRLTPDTDKYYRHMYLYIFVYVKGIDYILAFTQVPNIKFHLLHKA